MAMAAYGRVGMLGILLLAILWMHETEASSAASASSTQTTSATPAASTTPSTTTAFPTGVRPLNQGVIATTGVCSTTARAASMLAPQGACMYVEDNHWQAYCNADGSISAQIFDDTECTQPRDLIHIDADDCPMYCDHLSSDHQVLLLIHPDDCSATPMGIMPLVEETCSLSFFERAFGIDYARVCGSASSCPSNKRYLPEYATIEATCLNDRVTLSLFNASGCGGTATTHTFNANECIDGETFGIDNNPKWKSLFGGAKPVLSLQCHGYHAPTLSGGTTLAAASTTSGSMLPESATWLLIQLATVAFLLLS